MFLENVVLGTLTTNFFANFHASKFISMFGFTIVMLVCCRETPYLIIYSVNPVTRRRTLNNMLKEQQGTCT